MKNKMLMSGLALFTFWVAFSLGYRRGVNNERQAWFSTAEIERTGQHDFKIVYNSPHTGVRVSWRGAVNGPDPRSYKKYGLEP